MEKMMNIETNENDTTIVHDENTFPNNTNETEEKKGKKRIPVLESHVRIAFTAIDNTPTNINSSAAVEEQTKMILQDAKESFKSNILSMVEPTNEYPLPYESMIRRKRHSHPHTNDDSSSSSEDEDEVSLSSSSSVEEEEEEYDEDELLDQEAVKRVKELRNEMRTSAHRISNLQSNVINQLIQKINQEIYKFQQSSCEEELDTHSPQQQKEEQTELKVMETSLQKLISTLQSIDTQMPDRLDHLQETIQTIQTTLSSSSSSSVDAAISSRTNEGTNKKLPTQSITTTVTESNMNGNDETNMDPERRFGQFMYRFTRH